MADDPTDLPDVTGGLTTEIDPVELCNEMQRGFPLQFQLCYAAVVNRKLVQEITVQRAMLAQLQEQQAQQAEPEPTVEEVPDVPKEPFTLPPSPATAG